MEHERFLRAFLQELSQLQYQSGIHELNLRMDHEVDIRNMEHKLDQERSDAKWQEIRTAIRDIQSELHQTRLHFIAVDSKLSGFDSDIRALHSKVSSDQLRIESRLGDLRSDLRGIETQVSSMHSDHSRLESKLGDLDTEHSRLESKVTEHLDSKLSGPCQSLDTFTVCLLLIVVGAFLVSFIKSRGHSLSPL